MIKILINLGMLENPQFAKGHLQKQIQMKLKDQCLLVKLKKKQRFFCTLTTLTQHHIGSLRQCGKK